MLLWALTASTAYFSGVGGIRRREKEGEEARFTRASEVLGLMGAGVGFVLPALVWILLFHVRRPRAILPLFASETGRSVSAYFLGPQSALVRSAPETQPLLAPDESTTAFRTSIDGATVPQTPTWMTEHASDETDEATTVLLARKERQLQRRTRGRRLWQDVLVLVGVLPFGVALLVLGALELSRGGW